MPTRAIKTKTDFRTKHGRLWAAAACLGTVVMLTGTGATLAHEADGHPAKIHEGSCDTLGRVAFPLSGVGGSIDVEGAPVATPTTVNAPAAYEVVLSETLIDTTIEDLLAAEHAVMVYESDEDLSAISCGNLGGAMLGNTLVTALGESGVPGHVGFAVFRPEGDGTVVSIYLAHGVSELSSAGTAADEHAKDEAGDHAHEEGDEHDAAATPAA